MSLSNDSAKDFYLILVDNEGNEYGSEDGYPYQRVFKVASSCSDRAIQVPYTARAVEIMYRNKAFYTRDIGSREDTTELTLGDKLLEEDAEAIAKAIHPEAILYRGFGDDGCRYWERVRILRPAGESPSDNLFLLLPKRSVDEVFPNAHDWETKFYSITHLTKREIVEELRKTSFFFMNQNPDPATWEDDHWKHAAAKLGDCMWNLWQGL